MIILTQDERDRFAKWCEENRDADQILIRQMEKIRVTEGMMQQRRFDVACYDRVMRILNNIEGMTIK